MQASWLDDLGPALPERTWQRPPGATLVGTYCRLEPLDLNRHAPDLFNQMVREDREGRQWMFLASMGPFESCEAFVHAWERFAHAVDNITYAVIPTDPSSGLEEVATGQFSFLRIRPEAGSIEVGFVRFPPQMARSRVTTEAQFLLMKHVFDDLGYRRYEWKCNDANTPSMVTAERLGFRFEGTFRQDQINHGRNRNTAWWSIIDSEWAGLKAAYQKWLAADNFDEHGQQKTRLSALVQAHR